MSLESSPRAKSRLAKSSQSLEGSKPDQSSNKYSFLSPSAKIREKSQVIDHATQPLPHRVATNHHISTDSPILVQFFKIRLKFIVLLVLGLLSLVSCIYILLAVPPDKIANVVFYHSYLPLLVSLFGTVFFTASFLLLHSRRAFLLAICVTLVAFCKVQDVLITEVLLVVVFAGAIVLELLFSFLFKK